MQQQKYARSSLFRHSTHTDSVYNVSVLEKETQNSACCRTTIYLFSLQFMATRCAVDLLRTSEHGIPFSNWNGTNWKDRFLYMCFRLHITNALWLSVDTLLPSTVQRFIRQFQPKNAIFKRKTSSKWLTAHWATDWMPSYKACITSMHRTTGHELHFGQSVRIFFSFFTFLNRILSENLLKFFLNDSNS